MLWMIFGLGIVIIAVIGLFVYLLFFEHAPEKKPKLQKSSPQDIKTDKKLGEGLTNISLLHEDFADIKQTMRTYIIGLDDLIHSIFLSLLTQGHILVQGAPGLAKTKTLHLMAHLCDMQFKRIQFTPDMLPGDILGMEIYNPKRETFQTKYGPIMTNILLADEINRASPKVQSALLESMEEQQVSIGGKTQKLPFPFVVLATQNPIEHQGTYNLPEAQVDRFMAKVLVSYPSTQEEQQILHIGKTSFENEKSILTPDHIQQYIDEIQAIEVEDSISSYITNLVGNLRTPDPYIQYGPSPRASLSLLAMAKGIAFLAKRKHVTQDDVKHAYLPTVRHRVIPSYQMKVDKIDMDDFLVRKGSQVKAQ